MGSLSKRLEALEEQITPSGDKAKKLAHREFLRRLTPEEFDWLSEPGREAESRVPCPHVEMVECGCRGAEREQRGFEACPELKEEYLRRSTNLLERTEEVMSREPEDFTTRWRRRNGIAM